MGRYMVAEECSCKKVLQTAGVLMKDKAISLRILCKDKAMTWHLDIEFLKY